MTRHDSIAFIVGRDEVEDELQKELRAIDDELLNPQVIAVAHAYMPEGEFVLTTVTYRYDEA